MAESPHVVTRLETITHIPGKTTSQNPQLLQVDQTRVHAWIIDWEPACATRVASGSEFEPAFFYLIRILSNQSFAATRQK